MRRGKELHQESSSSAWALGEAQDPVARRRPVARRSRRLPVARAVLAPQAVRRAQAAPRHLPPRACTVPESVSNAAPASTVTRADSRASSFLRDPPPPFSPLPSCPPSPLRFQRRVVDDIPGRTLVLGLDRDLDRDSRLAMTAMLAGRWSSPSAHLGPRRLRPCRAGPAYRQRLPAAGAASNCMLDAARVRALPNARSQHCSRAQVRTNPIWPGPGTHCSADFRTRTNSAPPACHARGVLATVSLHAHVLLAMRSY